MKDRRIVNKPKDTPVAGEENITVKTPPVYTIDQKVAALEHYVVSMDPYIKALVEDMKVVKAKVDSLNDEITRLAGIQSRGNSYLDGKLQQIDNTFEGLVLIIKKIDEQYKELMSDIEFEDQPDGTMTSDDNSEPTEPENTVDPKNND